MTDPTHHPSKLGAADGADDGFSLLRVVNVALGNVRLLLGLPILLTVGVLTFVLVRGREYSTSVVFVPSSSAGSLSQLAGLAARVGIPVPGQATGQSPEFYADLLRNAGFLRAVATDSFTVVRDDGSISGPLAKVLEIDEGSPEFTLDEAITQLQEEIIRSSSSIRTSAVNLSVTTEWPDLSEQIARSLLRKMDEQNLANRQFLADAEREFMQERVKASEAELRRAEDQLEAFLRTNREFRQDPKLLFEHDRLQRGVVMRQQVYTGLVESLESARLEAIRNTPSISVVVPPLRALRPDRRHLGLKLASAGIAGLILAMIISLLRESIRDSTQRRSDFEEFATLKGKLLRRSEATRV